MRRLRSVARSMSRKGVMDVGSRCWGHVRWRLWGGALTAAAACLMVGCGGSVSSTVSNRAQTQAVARANAICRAYDAGVYAERAARERSGSGLGPERYLAHGEAELANLRAVTNEAGKIPRIGVYASDLEAQDRLLTTLSKRVARGYAAYTQVALSNTYRDEFRRVVARLADDEKALGLRACLGPRPRRPIGG